MASTTVVGVVAASVMFLGARQIFAGTLTLGNYIYLSMLLALMVSPMVQVVSIGTQITEAIAGLDRTLEVLNEAREDDDPRRVTPLDPDAIAGHIRFDSVSFSYIKGKEVLHEVSFDARPGTVTALVGSSGSGKSTIIGIVSAFHTADQGRVLLDGVDLATIQLENYRSRLGVVLQESFLFEGTIQENIAFGRPDAAPEAVIRAARIARVDEFAERLPDGYNTIARAILAKPPHPYSR